MCLIKAVWQLTLLKTALLAPNRSVYTAVKGRYGKGGNHPPQNSTVIGMEGR